jgi:hypothetical protein
MSVTKRERVEEFEVTPAKPVTENTVSSLHSAFRVLEAHVSDHVQHSGAESVLDMQAMWRLLSRTSDHPRMLAHL